MNRAWIGKTESFRSSKQDSAIPVKGRRVERWESRKGVCTFFINFWYALPYDDHSKNAKLPGHPVERDASVPVPLNTAKLPVANGFAG